MCDAIITRFRKSGVTIKAYAIRDGQRAPSWPMCRRRKGRIARSIRHRPGTRCLAPKNTPKRLWPSFRPRLDKGGSTRRPAANGFWNWVSYIPQGRRGGDALHAL